MKDIHYRLNIERAYGNKEVDTNLAFIMLINEAIEASVSEKYKIYPSQIEISDMNYHVNSTSKAPDILNEVKAVFKNDTQSYFRLYIAPRIINMKLRNYYWFNPEFHIKTILLVEDLYKSLYNGTSFYNNDLYKLETDTLFFSANSVDLSDSIEMQNSYNLKVYTAVKSLDKYEISPIIENEKSFIIIKLLEMNLNEAIYETYTINKEDFDEWLKNEIMNMGIFVLNDQLANKIKNKYNQVWWVKLVNSNKVSMMFE